MLALQEQYSEPFTIVLEIVVEINDCVSVIFNIALANQITIIKRSGNRFN